MRAVVGLVAAGTGLAAYRAVVTGSLTLDTGVGRSTRALGPLSVRAEAPPETVFDVIAGPYLRRTPRALADKLEVLERGSDMVLAAHRTPVRFGLVATTVETVRFRRPDRVDFRLVRGPVPHLVEQFRLRPDGAGTVLEYDGELAADFWAVGRWWGRRVGRTAGTRRCGRRSSRSALRRSGGREPPVSSEPARTG